MNQTLFACTNCGSQFTKWAGRCFECGKWGSLEESNVTSNEKRVTSKNKKTAKTTSFADIQHEATPRLQTGIEEIDRVLGGGIVPGSLTLLGGEPGIGKSTLILQIADCIMSRVLPPHQPRQGRGKGEGKRREGISVLYASGEESGSQIKIRIDRLGIDAKNIHYLGITDIDAIAATIAEQKPTLAIVDSIQTMSTADAPGEQGNVSQVRACTAKLLETAKQTNVPIIVIGHVTKDGAVAGPKTLEHLVDVVLTLEGDRTHLYRLLRSSKNRFGSVDEVGVFEMQEKGLTPVANPASAFLDDQTMRNSGIAVTVVIEGTRPFLMEIQALVTKTVFGYPQRRAIGFDLNRLQLLLAVLTRRLKLPLGSHDVFVNVVGGFTIKDPASDLAVCCAVISALHDRPLPQKMVVIGEVGLGGEIRRIPQIEKRLKEAKKLGFSRTIAPPEIKTLNEALNILRG